MAQHRSGAAGEDRGQPPAFVSQRCVPQRVDATVHEPSAPRLTRESTAAPVTPKSSSWVLVTTPCCLSASSAS